MDSAGSRAAAAAAVGEVDGGRGVTDDAAAAGPAITTELRLSATATPVCVDEWLDEVSFDLGTNHTREIANHPSEIDLGTRQIFIIYQECACAKPRGVGRRFQFDKLRPSWTTLTMFSSSRTIHQHSLQSIDRSIGGSLQQQGRLLLRRGRSAVFRHSAIASVHMCTARPKPARRHCYVTSKAVLVLVLGLLSLSSLAAGFVPSHQRHGASRWVMRAYEGVQWQCMAQPIR